MPNEYLTRIKPYLDNIDPLQPIPTTLEPSFKLDNDIKALVFDIYGTLIISASGDLDKSNVTYDGLTKALNEAGLFWVKSDIEKDAKALLQLFHDTVGLHHKNLIAQGHPYPEVDIIAVWQSCIVTGLENNWIKANKEYDLYALTVVFELLSNAVYPMPDMNYTLNKLFNGKLPLGIVSNAQFYTPLIMNYFIHNQVDSAEHVKGFDEDISLYSYKLKRSKPDTYLFANLAESFKNKYNLKPNEVLFVGNDMLKDVWTASQLGFKTALFAADKRSLRIRETDERTKNLKADYIITELSQIFNIINI